MRGSSVHAVSRTYVTTPIYYVNAEPHLGHAYTTIIGDAITRWSRLMGIPTKFLTGTDEHGLKIQQAAEAAGVSPQAFTDDIAPKFAAAWDKLNIANDDFIRTTEQRHKDAVAELLQRCYDAGDIELDTFAGKYCVACEEYYSDDELVDERRHRRRGRAVPDPPAPGRVLRGGELLLPAQPVPGPPPRLVREAPHGDDPRTPRQRGPRADPRRTA